VSCAKPTPPPDPVTISFAYPEWYGEHFELLAEEFHESHPHITVELRPVPESVFIQTFWVGDADAFVSGTRFTDFGNGAPATQRLMVEEGHIMDLRPFIQADGAFNPQDFYLGDAAFWAEEDEIWGVPLGAGMAVVYYNQDLFDQYGVAYPEPGWTWTDFLDAALALSDPDAGVFGYAVTRYADAANFVYQHGGRLLDDLRTPTAVTYDDPLTIEAVEWYVALFHEHGVAPTMEQLQRSVGGSGTDYPIIEAIQNGKVGMWMGEFWQQPWEEESEQGFRWGMAPLPREAQAVSLSTSDNLFIFAEAGNPAACWEWLSFVSRRMPPRWLVPMRESLVESEDYERLVGAQAAAVTRASKDGILLVSPRALGELGGYRQFVEAIVIEGREAPQEILERAQREADRTSP
jgi:multiple sugar transport system substrate-binding protein